MGRKRNRSPNRSRHPDAPREKRVRVETLLYEETELSLHLPSQTPAVLSHLPPLLRENRRMRTEGHKSAIELIKTHLHPNPQWPDARSLHRELDHLSHPQTSGGTREPRRGKQAWPPAKPGLTFLPLDNTPLRERPRLICVSARNGDLYHCHYRHDAKRIHVTPKSRRAGT